MWFKIQLTTPFYFFSMSVSFLCMRVCLFLSLSVYCLSSVKCRLHFLWSFFFYLKNWVVVCLVYWHCFERYILHSYRCFDSFSFLFSGNLILLLWSDILVLRACVDLIHSFFYICYIRLCWLRFLNCCLNFYLLWTLFWIFEGLGFSIDNNITYSTSFILAFCNLMCCMFPECSRGEYF